jgi:hypothetical protein
VGVGVGAGSGVSYLPFAIIRLFVFSESSSILPLAHAHHLFVFGLTSCRFRGLALMDTDLRKRTCEIDYFRTISCGIESPTPHEIVRK